MREMLTTCEALGSIFSAENVDFSRIIAIIGNKHMILSDREIKKIIGDVLIGADPNLVSPNGIELRLGHEVRFLSTNERKKVPEGHFVTVHPGEAVIITSLEKLDFKKATVHRHFASAMLMALITPTTTMMREGMLQCATKVHAGYSGELNWGFRNSSSKDFTIQQGEPIFNLTLFLLQGNEVPEVAYGEKESHSYQNTSGIAVSQRKLPSDIPKDCIVTSSFHKLDPAVQLREAGHPFNYIGTELMALQGKFELVNSGVAALNTKMDVAKTDLATHVDHAFQNKFLWAGSLCIGILCGLFALRGFLQQKAHFTQNDITWLALAGAMIIPFLGWILFFRRK